MGIQVGDNFDHKSKKPLDARTSYATLALMKAVTDANMNEGCLAYCAETDTYYKFLSTNTVDADTGKWREFEAGSGGGHTIEDSEGTDLTQRDILQFGEGFKAEDDSTNEKTVISPDVMQSGDMDDVITPLPSVQPRYQKYSTEEHIVGEWIDGKPIYQKVVLLPSEVSFTNKNSWTNIVELPNANALISVVCLLDNSFRQPPIPIAIVNGYLAYYTTATIESVIKTNKIILQYTKTTD